MSSNMHSIPWGNNFELRYLKRQFSEKEIQQATQAVPAKFNAPKDMFVAINKPDSNIIANVGQGRKLIARFPVQCSFATGGVPVALQKALTDAANFLKLQA